MAPVVPRLLGYHSPSRRKLLLVTLDELGTPFALPAIEGHFTCLLALDIAVPLDANELGRFCSRLLQLGCAYLCTWGSDCERVHDIMDEQVIGSDPPRTYLGCVMTTWHTNDTLKDVLRYFLDCAQPDEEYAPHGCKVGLIVSLGSSKWNRAIEQYVRRRSKRQLPIRN